MADIPGHQNVLNSPSRRRYGAVELLQGEAFDALFRDFQRDAFHLEVQDTYRTPDESGPSISFSPVSTTTSSGSSPGSPSSATPPKPDASSGGHAW